MGIASRSKRAARSDSVSSGARSSSSVTGSAESSAFDDSSGTALLSPWVRGTRFAIGDETTRPTPVRRDAAGTGVSNRADVT
ncbi:hypothetical protein GCM10009836_66420 [Pseudonocardia ailaonensis]|uniref:Uncharacterized protein n=1 Tax=Pseudonocardia ailaonensis TaxID=367279 RepID=A0ABN2NMG9_9PSEU